MNEYKRIFSAYKKREHSQVLKNKLFKYENAAHAFRIQERLYKTMLLLRNYGYHPLSEFRILDVGCGDGNMLRQFMQWGAMPEKVAGIELREEPIEEARYLNPDIDVCCGSATTLPWEDNSFDLVCQHTVFTSIIDTKMKQMIANEMKRVLKPKGAVLWYDFKYNNPNNPDVSGVKIDEIRSLFQGLEIFLHSITLAPPIARRLPESFLPVLYPLLALFPFLRTHYLGLFKNPFS